MAIVYTNRDKEMQNFLIGSSLDVELGENNDLQLSMALEDYGVVSDGCFVFDYEMPQFGGRLDKVSVDTNSQSVTWTGKSFSGMLSEKVVVPPGGKSYLTISGSFGHVINELLSRTGLNDIFYTDLPDSSGVGGTHQIKRYVTVLSALESIAESIDFSIKMLYDKNEKKILITGENIKTVGIGEEYNSDQFSFSVEKDYRKTNFLICLGKGELSARTVVYLFYDEETDTIREVSDYMTDAIQAVYDYSNAESREELVKGGIERLLELRNTENIDISPPEDEIYNVGDNITAKENNTGIVAVKKVKKIIYVSDGETKSIRYETV